MSAADPLAAGADAYRRGDVTTALQIFDEIARTDAGGLRARALVDKATMMDHLGDHHGAIAVYRDALGALADDTDDVKASVLVNLSQSLTDVGDLDGAFEAATRARGLLVGDGVVGDVLVACYASLTAISIHRQHWATALELATEALDVTMVHAPDRLGNALQNIAVANSGIGRWELAEDFWRQAIDAFDESGDAIGAAETQYNLAALYVRAGRTEDAEPLLNACLTTFDRTGKHDRSAAATKTLGVLADARGDAPRAKELYQRSLESFLASGAILDAASVQTLLATHAFAEGNLNEGEAILAEAFSAAASRGIGLLSAQIDFWHATLLEAVVVDSAARDPEHPDTATLARALDLAVTAAVAIDAERHSLADGQQRDQWNRQVAAPSMQLAFRLAYLAQDAHVIAELIETQCAGATLDRSTLAAEPTAPTSLAEPALHSAIVGALGSGLRVSPPPRLSMAWDGRIALARQTEAAQNRYGTTLRDDRVLPVW
ncbi:tetratricopeptide repeat protein [Antrihabitans stalactiti]|uniref:Tetratricopeptide repeat protein n=1 Tax=Antrihabitans stalactiti TaxID=2584121 RepID=A0A848KKD2_9NOCA|nr:tetratricopeptide repeat protein [Antrihabitans stalactiti]NMN99145.1 tetratricopeptide repeat protein [Antrihabitans stalactiti]